MNNRYSAFDIIVLIGFALIIAALGTTTFIENAEPFDILISLGAWIIASFFILVFVHGTIRGVPRRKIKIPKGLAVLTLGISGVLFLSAWLVSNT